MRCEELAEGLAGIRFFSRGQGMKQRMRFLLGAVVSVAASFMPIGDVAADGAVKPTRAWLTWEPLPALPDPLGVAGPFVGTHGNALIVAGGANFTTADAADLWEVPKRWQADAFVLVRDGDGGLLPPNAAVRLVGMDEASGLSKVCVYVCV